MKKERKVLRKSLLILAIVMALMVVACFVYVQDYYRADEAAIRAFCEEAADVTVETWKDDTMVFSPKEPVAGLIFYPGGKVEYTAYVPLMWELAQEGDGTPTMSGEEQIKETAKRILELVAE